MTTTILQPVPQKAAPTTTMSPASPVPPHEFTPFTPKNPLKRSYKEDDDDDKEPSAFESPAKRPRRNKENLYHSNTSSALSTPRRMKHGSKLRSINCSRLNSPRRPHHSSNVSSAHASPACSPRRNGFIERVPSSNSPQQFPPLSSVKFTMHMNLNQNQAPCEVTTTSPTYVEDPNDPLACNEICDEFGPFLDSILQSSHCGSPIPSPRVQTPTNFDGSSTFVGVSPSACTSRQGSPGLSGYVFSMPCQESFFNPTPAPSTESPPFLSVTEVGLMCFI